MSRPMVMAMCGTVPCGPMLARFRVRKAHKGRLVRKVLLGRPARKAPKEILVHKALPARKVHKDNRASKV